MTIPYPSRRSQGPSETTMRTRRTLFTLGLLCSVALFACSDSSSTGPDLPITGDGFMKAKISGAHTGTIDITNIGPAGIGDKEGQVAGAQWEDEDGYRLVTIGGWSHFFDSDRDGYALTFLILDPETRTYSGSELCTEVDFELEVESCRVYAFLVGTEGGPTSGVGFEVDLDSGQLQITELNERNVAGTFALSGEGTAFSPEFEDDGKPIGTIEVKDGAFDLPVVNDLFF